MVWFLFSRETSLGSFLDALTFGVSFGFLISVPYFVGYTPKLPTKNTDGVPSCYTGWLKTVSQSYWFSQSPIILWRITPNIKLSIKVSLIAHVAAVYSPAAKKTRCAHLWWSAAFDRCRGHRQLQRKDDLAWDQWPWRLGYETPESLHRDYMIDIYIKHIIYINIDTNILLYLLLSV